MAFPIPRLRRLRANPAIRDMLRETKVSLGDLIYPIFVEEELDDFAPVDSMPGIFRIPERKLDVAVKEIAGTGGDKISPGSKINEVCERQRKTVVAPHVRISGGADRLRDRTPGYRRTARYRRTGTRVRRKRSASTTDRERRGHGRGGGT